MLPKPMVIAKAYSKMGGGLVVDLATGATRFAVSPEGVISDSQTGLEWIVGPDRNMNYAQAVQWVAGCNVVGGGWLMPTRQQLKTLYQKGVGECNMDPSFKTTGWGVWAEPRDSSSAWAFSFSTGNEYCSTRDDSHKLRAFGVRSRSR